jgi:hypothetical protein
LQVNDINESQVEVTKEAELKVDKVDKVIELSAIFLENFKKISM